MKIIISPAKKMRVATDSMETVGVPVYVKETGRLLEVLRGYSFEMCIRDRSMTRRRWRRPLDG